MVRQESFEVESPDEFFKAIENDPVGRGGRLEGVAVRGAASINDVTVTVALRLLAESFTFYQDGTYATGVGGSVTFGTGDACGMSV